EARCVEAPPRSSNAELMQAIAPLAVILVAAFSDGDQPINTFAGGRDRGELLAWLRNTARHERLGRARTNRFNASTVYLFNESMADYETFEHDVLVIGAGGAGLRAAIEGSAAGVSVGLICKSLLGKAHTVMAEGGIAAALANVDERDNWKVHFADTMRGGQYA